MNTDNWFIKIICAMAIVFLTLSCSLTSGIREDGQTPSAGTGPAGNAAGGILTDPATGLNQLSVYKATLKQDLAGTLDGQPYERHIVYELSKQPPTGAFDYSNTVSGTDTRSISLRLIMLDGAFYQWEQPQSDCTGSVDQPSAIPVTEPASLLLPVRNAVQAGNEMVNGIASLHYTFSRENLNIAKTSEIVTGDVWIAENGGYVTRYLLNVALPEKITGKDLEVSQTWEYQLELSGSEDVISLPEGCRPVPVEIIWPDGAENIAYGSGSLSFDTTLEAGEVVDFFIQQLSTLGWQPPDSMPASPVSVPLLMDFRQGDQVLSLFLSNTDDSMMNVDLQIIYIPDQKPGSGSGPETAPTVEPGQLPTIDPAESGLPEDIPLYPGSVDLMKTGDFVMFLVPEPVDVAASFYREQMPANQWALENEISASGTVTQMWSKGNSGMMITFSMEGDHCRVIIALPEQ